MIPSTCEEWIRYVWKVKRGFIRLNILVDVDAKMVLAFVIADESVGESSRLPTLLDEALEKLGMPGRVGTSRVVATLMGDKAYDSRENFSHCSKRGVVALIPIKVNANCRAGGVDRTRTEAVLDQLVEGRAQPSARSPPFWRMNGVPTKSTGRGAPIRARQMGRRWCVLAAQENPGWGSPSRKVPCVIRAVANKINVYNWMQQISGEAARAVSPDRRIPAAEPAGSRHVDSPHSCPTTAIHRMTPRRALSACQGRTVQRPARHRRKAGIIGIAGLCNKTKYKFRPN